MGAGRISCALLLVILVNMQLTAGKPFFDFLDLFSDDDYEEEEPSDEDSDYDLFDMVFCYLGGSECTTRKPKTTTTTTTTIKPETFFIPASLTGQNVTIGKRGGSWIVQFFPWLADMTTPKPTTTAAPTTAVVATTVATTVAAAAGNATANATTAAP